MKFQINPQIKKRITFLIPYLRIFIGIFAFVTLFLLIADSFSNTSSKVEAQEVMGSVLGVGTSLTSQEIVVTSSNGISFSIAQPTDEDIAAAEEKYAEKLREIEEEKKRIEEQKRKERDSKIAALQGYLVRQKSPMAPYAGIIYDSCIPYGAHYCKYILAIAGVESGFGRVCPPHNAWGWGGVRYPSWEYSIPYVTNQIAKNYYLRGYTTFEKLAYSGYGPNNPEAWIKNLYYFYNQMPAL